MTTNEAKQLIRILIRIGISKDAAFEVVDEINTSSHNERMAKLERFRYELNAEEQRNRNGNTIK